MTPRSRPDVPGSSRAQVAARRRRDLGWSGRSRTAARPVVRVPVQGGLAPQLPPAPIDDVWDRHGRSAYALACALLGDEDAATGVVRLAIQDYARSAVGVPADEERRVLTRHVYWRSREVALAPRTLRLPAAMVWIGQLAHLQRASLALCTFGGLTHREAADLLGVPPVDVARSLTAGLQELGHLATGSASA